LPAAPVQIQADAEALNKVFSNLFSNAVKYAERMVQIQLINPAKDDQVVRIEVSNDGRIIPPDMREKIFEPFVRLKESTKQKGTGIGLALARSLTELHGGKVYLSDERNGMNVFVLELPVGTNAIKQKELTKTVEKPIVS
jgi:signal transduction histidine kinase